MDRRSFVGRMVVITGLSPLWPDVQEPAATPGEPILVRSGQTRGVSGKTAATSDWRCKLRTPDLGGRLSIIRAEHPPLTGPQLHVHRDVDEWFYIEKGEFVVEVGGKLHYLAQGDTLLAPQRIPHRYLNGPDPGDLVIAFSPGGRMEEFFEELALRRRSPSVHATQEEARARLTALYARYNMDLIGHGSLSEVDFQKAKASA